MLTIVHPLVFGNRLRLPIEVPYEGHHRKYRGTELEWMLQPAGCVDVRLRYLDVNMVQFERIDRPQLECLLSVVQDRGQADTLLVSGRFRSPGCSNGR